jgi:hypothetical protein
VSERRVEVELSWHGEGLPAGAPVRLDGRKVGFLVDGVAGVRGPRRVKAMLDRDVVDKLGDNSGYGMPKASFLITRD